MATLVKDLFLIISLIWDKIAVVLEPYTTVMFVALIFNVCVATLLWIIIKKPVEDNEDYWQMKEYNNREKEYSHESNVNDNKNERKQHEYATDSEPGTYKSKHDASSTKDEEEKQDPG